MGHFDRAKWCTDGGHSDIFVSDIEPLFVIPPAPSTMKTDLTFPFLRLFGVFLVTSVLFTGCKKEEEKVVIPGIPGLQLPVNEANGVSHLPTFQWNAVDGAVSYQLQTSTSGSDFSNLKDYGTTSGTSFRNSNEYYENGVYYWRVRAHNSAGDGGWSEVRSFAVDNNSPDAQGPVFGKLLFYHPTMPSGVTYQITISGLSQQMLSCAGAYPSDCEAPASCEFARFTNVYSSSFYTTITYASGPQQGQTRYTGYISGNLGICTRVNVASL